MKVGKCWVMILLSLGVFESVNATSLTLMDKIPTVNSSGGIAYDVSSDGRFLAGFSVGGDAITAVRWDASGAATSCGFKNALAVGISGDGNRLVGYGYENGENTTFLIDVKTQLISKNLFDPITRQSTQINGISADGNTVVGSLCCGSGERPICFHGLHRKRPSYWKSNA